MSNVTYSPNHRQAGAPVINIESKPRTASGLCSQCYLVAKVIHLQSLSSLVCVYVHILHNALTLVGRAKDTKKMKEQ
jgi:hypothetical protein